MASPVRVRPQHGFGESVPPLGREVACSLIEGSPLPVLVTPRKASLGASAAAFVAWLDAHMGAVDALLRESGALLFRGFCLRGTADFNEFATRFPEHRYRYVAGASPREGIAGRVFESTRIPAS